MTAIREAAFDPPLFAELAEKFPGKAPPDDLLKNYLSRKGFAPGALASVVLAYRQTSDMVGGVSPAYDSGVPDEEVFPMQTPYPAAPSQPQRPSVQPVEIERSLGRWDFEGNQYVRMAASPDLDTETALDMLETLIDIKRKELAAKAKAAIRALEAPNRKVENNDGSAE